MELSPFNVDTVLKRFDRTTPEPQIQILGWKLSFKLTKFVTPHSNKDRLTKLKNLFTNISSNEKQFVKLPIFLSNFVFLSDFL